MSAVDVGARNYEFALRPPPHHALNGVGGAGHLAVPVIAFAMEGFFGPYSLFRGRMG